MGVLALGLTSVMDRPSPRGRWILAVAATSLLVSGVHASAAMMVPVFGVVTILMCRRPDGWRARDAMPVAVLAAALACALPSMLMLFSAVAWQRAATVSNWFWNFFLPSHLFVAPGSPGFCGMFLTPTVVPMAIGVYALIRGDAESAGSMARLRPMIAAGCIGAPLAAAIAGPPPLDAHALVVAPLGALLATVGGSLMWRRGRLVGRFVLGGLTAVAAFQAFVCLS